MGEAVVTHFKPLPVKLK